MAKRRTMLALMERKRAVRNLAQAREQLVKGERSIARLSAHIEKRRAAGHDVKAAEKLLMHFKEIQVSHLDSRVSFMKAMRDLRR